VAAAQLLALPEPPTAILAANDQLAIGVLQTAWRLGLRVPDDLSIVGFDDVPVAGYLAPPLTTVRQPIAEMGRRATAALIDLLEGHTDTPQDASLVLHPELVIRASSAPPRES
jgi:LacI family transcriptional regulator